MSYEKILNAARNQDSSDLKQILRDSCIDVNKTSSIDRWSAATQLAYENQQEAVNFLRAYGAHIDNIAFGAAFGRHREYADALLGEGAHINPIAFAAAWAGDFEYAISLLKRGAHIDAVADGAACGGHYACADFLLQQGANLDTVAARAARHGHLKYAEFLRQQGANIDDIAFNAAFFCGRSQYLAFLLQEGADINKVASGAAWGGYFELADALIQKGTDIQCVAAGAIAGGHFKYVKTLLRKGADINRVARMAAYEGHRKFADLCIREGADISSIAREAARGRHPAYADFLRQKKGADIDYIVLGAAWGVDRAYAESLINLGANINSAVYGAINGGDREYANALLLRDADINWATAAAVLASDPQYVTSLLEQGADIDRVVDNVATINDDLEYDIKSLRQAGAHSQSILDSIMIDYKDLRSMEFFFIRYSNVIDMHVHAQKTVLNFLKGRCLEKFKDIDQALQFLFYFENENFRYFILEAMQALPNECQCIQHPIENIHKKMEHIINFKNKYSLVLQQAIWIQKMNVSSLYCFLIQGIPSLLYAPTHSHLDSNPVPALPINVITRIAEYAFPAQSWGFLKSLRLKFIHALLCHSIYCHSQLPSSNLPSPRANANRFQTTISFVGFDTLREACQQQNDPEMDHIFLRSYNRLSM